MLANNEPLRLPIKGSALTKNYSRKFTLSDLRNMRLFQNLSEKELAAMARILQYLKCKKDQVVIYEGTPGSSIYLVKSGEFRATHVVRVKNVDLATFLAGDHFGEVSFIDSLPRSATIYASEESELLVLTQQPFKLMMSRHPKFLRKIIGALLIDLCAKLRRRNESVDCDICDQLPVAVFELALNGKISYANRSGLSVFGYEETELVEGINFSQMIVPEDKERFVQRLRHFPGQEGQKQAEYSVVTKDGKVFPAAIHCDPISKGDHICGWRITILDISERKKIEEELRTAQNDLELRIIERTTRLRESERRYSLAVQGANDGIWEWNLETNEIHFSNRWKSMLGHTESEIENRLEEWFERIHPDDINKVQRAILHYKNGISAQLEVEYRIRCSDDQYRWMLCRGLAIRDDGGNVYRMAGSQTDITDRHQLQDELLRNAFYDSVTNLPNRAFFNHRLNQTYQQMKKDPKHSFAILYLDLDRFKVVNDSLGHGLGDQLLIFVAERLKAIIGPDDTVARLGGDEFAILLNDISDLEAPVCMAKQILSAFSAPFRLANSNVYATASIGIAYSSSNVLRLKSAGVDTSAQELVGPEELLRDADIAMYRAKSRGKACYEVFDNETHPSIYENLQFETDLRLGLERQEYKSHYQPIISLETGRICGFESLIRWNHPQRGMIQPSEFVGTIEENGLIIPINKQLMLEACFELKEWNLEFQQESPLFISVNVSGKQLMQNDFLDQIKEVLHQTGIDPALLKLEITESIMIENRDVTILMLPKLKELGIELCLDDFGTGYSSLGSIHRFPIDTLKIDRSFIHGMAVIDENLQIVNTIVGLARSLHMKVVAEGVEDALELKQLRALNCEYAQGYFFSAPVSGTEARQLLLQQPHW